MNLWRSLYKFSSQKWRPAELFIWSLLMTVALFELPADGFKSSSTGHGITSGGTRSGNPHRHKHRHKSRSSKHSSTFTSGPQQQQYDQLFSRSSSVTSIVPEEEISLASAPAAASAATRILFDSQHNQQSVLGESSNAFPSSALPDTLVANTAASGRNTTSWPPSFSKPRFHRPSSQSSGPPSSTIKWQKAPVSQPSPLVNCSWCTNHDQLAKVRLGMIKQRILSRLGYGGTLPDASYRDIPKNSPLQKLIEDFSMQSDSPAFGLRPGDAYQQDDEDGEAQIQGMYVLAQPLSEEKANPSTDNMNVQYFSFSKALMRNKISDAWLWLYMKADRSPDEMTREQDEFQDSEEVSFMNMGTRSKRKGSIPIYRVPRPRLGHEFESAILTLVGNVTRPRDRNAWVRLNVRHLVQDWFRDPSSNYGIIIGGPGEPDVSSIVMRASNATIDSDDGRIPYLEIEVSHHSRRSRTKRNAGLDCDDSLRNKNLCCRHPLIVDFETIGWDWIIAPRSYHAFHCAGYCEPMHIPEYQHTYILGHKHIVDTDINGHDPRSLYGNRPPPVACCAPKKLSPLSLLHFTPDSEIIVSKVPEMITDSCTCA